MEVKRIASFAIGPIGAAALGLISLPLTARLFSAEDIGRIAILYVLLNFSTLALSVGLDQAYVREYHESKDRPKLLATVTLPGIILFVILGIIIAIFSDGILTILFDTTSREISPLLILCIAAAFSGRFLSLIVRMQGSGSIYSISQILPKVIILIFLAAIYYQIFVADFIQLLIIHTTSLASVSAYLAFATKREVSLGYSSTFDKDLLHGLLKFGGPLTIASLAYWGLSSLDRVLLRNYSSLEQLGLYSVAASFAASASILQNIFSTVWAPIVYKWASEGLLTSTLDQINEKILCVLAFCFTATGLFAWLFKYILPPQYESVQYIVIACLAAPLFYTLSESTVVGLGVSKRTDLSMAAAIVALCANLASNYFFSSRYGARGVAVGTAFSFWIFLVARTELSCWAWRPIKRIKIYLVTTLCLVLASATTLFGEAFYGFTQIPWLVVACIFTVWFRETLISFVKAVRRNSS